MAVTAGAYGVVAAAGMVLLAPWPAMAWVLLVAALAVEPVRRQAGSLTLLLEEDGAWRLRDPAGTRSVRFAAVKAYPGCIVLTLRGRFAGRRIRIPVDACPADVHRRLRKALLWP